MSKGCSTLVSFGYFFELYRCLWIVCRFIENGENNEENINTNRQLIFDSYQEYKQFNGYGLPAIAKRGETTCNGNLVNYFSDKRHQNCICSK